MEQIVITGASSAIGMAIARRLASHNKPMLLHANSRAIEWQEAPEKVETIVADFSDENSLEHFLSRLQHTSILVNVAARVDTGLLPMISRESMEQMIRINILAFSRICQQVIPSMCRHRHGIIINVSSVVASKTYRGQSVYAGTKAYMESFSKAIAAEYATKGIRCNCVAPGSISSGSFARMVKETGGQPGGLNASGKAGSPGDVASAVAFLCSPEAAYINGEVLHVDGGHWLGL